MRITSSPVVVQQTNYQANAASTAQKALDRSQQLAFPKTSADHHFVRQALRSLWLTRYRLFFRSVKTLEGLASQTVSTQMSGASLNRLLLAVDHAARFTPNATSLVRTLAAQRLLARHGYRTELHLGLHKRAWLTYRGHVIVGRVFFPGDEETQNTFLA